MTKAADLANGVGTGAQNVLALDAAGKIPAVDASQVTGVASSPVGSVVAFAGSAAPSGWALCYGQALSRTGFADLFAAIGTAFGVGDGSTTFNLPDLRGRVPAGKDNMGGTAASRLTSASGVTGTTLGAVGGSETHTLTIAQMPAHTHSITSLSSGTTGGSQGGLYNNYQNSPSAQNSGSQGGGSAHNNTQPTIVLNYIIKT